MCLPNKQTGVRLKFVSHTRTRTRGPAPVLSLLHSPGMPVCLIFPLFSLSLAAAKKQYRQARKFSNLIDNLTTRANKQTNKHANRQRTTTIAKATGEKKKSAIKMKSKRNDFFFLSARGSRSLVRMCDLVLFRTLHVKQRPQRRTKLTHVSHARACLHSPPVDFSPLLKRTQSSEPIVLVRPYQCGSFWRSVARTMTFAKGGALVCLTAATSRMTRPGGANLSTGFILALPSGLFELLLRKREFYYK